MKSISRRLCSLAAVLVFIAVSAAHSETKPEYRFSNGVCDGGAKWWSVAIYYEGILTMIEGVNCDGEYYRRWQCPPIILSHDPTDGRTATHSGVCEAGAWRSIIMWNSNGEPTSVEGFSCADQGYTMTCEASAGGN